MAIQGSPVIFEKTFGNISCYKRCGVGLVRCKSNLTAERWHKDPAFAGSRKSAAELKTAAAIAAPFYNLLPKGIRIFSLYRQFVGIAKKLLAKGTPISTIEETLALAVIRLHKMVEAPAEQSPKQSAQKETEYQSHSAAIKSVEKYWRVKLTTPSIKVLPSPNALRHKSRHRRTRAGSVSAAALSKQPHNIAA